MVTFVSIIMCYRSVDDSDMIWIVEDRGRSKKGVMERCGCGGRLGGKEKSFLWVECWITVGQDCRDSSQHDPPSHEVVVIT